MNLMVCWQVEGSVDKGWTSFRWRDDSLLEIRARSSSSWRVIWWAFLRSVLARKKEEKRQVSTCEVF